MPTTATVERAYEEVSRCVMTLVFDEPFYGHFLTGLNRIVTNDQTPTAAVAIRAGRPVLIVNPEFFMRTVTRRPERVAVIKHEVLHLLLQHLERVDWARSNRFVYNLAADLVVNQLIGRKWPLPASAITLDTFPRLSLPADRTVEQYYRMLLHGLDTIELTIISSHSDHAPWDDGLSDADRTLGRHEIARLARHARLRSGSSYSLLDEPVRTIVDALIEQVEPTVDWRRVLRMFGNSSRQTRIRNTLRRPSKRYGSYPGIKVQRSHRIVAAVDTSGSISDADLGDFFGEIRGMWRQGSEVTVVECDQIIQNTWTYRGGPPPTTVGGRGGTSFDPVFEWVRNQRERLDGVIYLTDGQAARPTIDPGCPVLWVLTPDGSAQHLEFGRSVTIQRGR